jgi:hypothetical protein
MPLFLYPLRHHNIALPETISEAAPSLMFGRFTGFSTWRFRSDGDPDLLTFLERLIG